MCKLRHPPVQITAVECHTHKKYNDLIISDANNNPTMAATCERHSETGLGRWAVATTTVHAEWVYWNDDYSCTFLFERYQD